MARDYKAEDIRVLEGLDAVRLRPGMYIGTTGIKGLHHILWEIVDNSIDEVANGYGDTIEIKLYEDGTASVEDNGRGIPVDIHPKLNVSAVEVVFTQLHAGGKFDNENYAHSGGLHGVGASVTNALSRNLTVEVYKNGTTYRMEFESKEVNGDSFPSLSGTISFTNAAPTFVTAACIPLLLLRVYKYTSCPLGLLPNTLFSTAILLSLSSYADIA